MFRDFAAIIRENYDEMARSGELYVVELQGDALWARYLESFPPGSNQIYKERAGHDCNTCKKFVRRLGMVVSIQGGALRTVWDAEIDDPVYSVVAHALAREIRARPIAHVFRASEPQYGTRITRSLKDDDLVVWHHFEGTVYDAHRARDGQQSAGELSATAHLLRRGLEELSLEAIDEIVSLLEADATAIYRGEEHLGGLRSFQALKRAYEGLDARARELFVWEHISNRAARFRNSVIGTLIQDLSEGVALDKAVKAFEHKVAPHNYKRPKALVTPRMIEVALKTIDALDLRASLERRHARVTDVSVNDILFVDRSSRPLMRDALRDALMSQVKPKPIESDHAVAIAIDEFLERIVPQVETMEVMVENKHTPNFVSITAPVHEGEPRLFSWNNDFSWSYDGNLADSSIKSRVKAAGGDVAASFRVSLGWFNYDDLDIHVVEPNGNHIYFANKCACLDVDMNVHDQGSREAVENVSWRSPQDGLYVVSVHNFKRREPIDVGFQLEVENHGEIQQFRYAEGLGNKEMVDALLIEMKGGSIVDLAPQSGVQNESTSREHWGVQTQTFTKVRTLMKSPNHWHGQSHGNAHWFFILEGCSNPYPTRGMYNENLRADLHEHRKVFEILGAKMMCPPAEEQLSGLGFSSTKNAAVLVRVRGAVNRLFEVQI